MDDLDRYIRARNKKSPGFAQKTKAAYRRRLMMHRLAEIRRRLELSQTKVAALMETSAAIVSRTESGANVTFETFEKYAIALAQLAKNAPSTKKKRAKSDVHEEIQEAMSEYLVFG